MVKPLYQKGWRVFNFHFSLQYVKELGELKRLAEELEAEIEGLQDAIKAEMTAQDVDTLTGADWKVTWKPVTSICRWGLFGSRRWRSW